MGLISLIFRGIWLPKWAIELCLEAILRGLSLLGTGGSSAFQPLVAESGSGFGIGDWFYGMENGL